MDRRQFLSAFGIGTLAAASTPLMPQRAVLEIDALGRRDLLEAGEEGTVDRLCRAIGKRDPVFFGNWLDPKFTRAKHLQYIGDIVAEEIERGNGRVIVCAPPRHAKSSLLSEIIPTWFLERWPEKRIMLTAYGDAFAATWGRKVRDRIVANQAKLAVRIRGNDHSAVNEWYTTLGGGMKTAGSMGQLLGLGADLWVTDDPIKNAQEAYSPLYQQRLRDWWQSVASTRFEPGATAVVTMQRWPGHDFVQWLIDGSEEGRESWKVLLIPCVYDEIAQRELGPCPLGRQVGDPLWPERYDAAWAVRRQRSLEDHSFWEAQYQQRPKRDDVTGRAYHAFDPIANVREVRYDPKLPLCWALDFNVDPMCSVICQVHETYRPPHFDSLTLRSDEEIRTKEIHVLAEIALPNSSTPDAVKAFIKKTEDWGRGQIEVAVYGDASGYSRKTSGNTDYQIIEQMLKNHGGYRFVFRAERKNPFVRDRVNTLNSAFFSTAGERRLFIDPQCRELRTDLLWMKWARTLTGAATDELDKSNPARSHISDALGYLVWKELRLASPSGFMGGDRVI